MQLSLLPQFGGSQITLRAAQVVIYNDVGTPVAVLGEFGPNGVIKVARAGDADFNATLRAFGYSGSPVDVEKRKLDAPPAGAALLAGPGFPR